MPIERAPWHNCSCSQNIEHFEHNISGAKKLPYGENEMKEVKEKVLMFYAALSVSIGIILQLLYMSGTMF